MRIVVIRPLQVYLLSAGGHLNGADADYWAAGKQLHGSERHTREVLTGPRYYKEELKAKYKDPGLASGSISFQISQLT